MGSRAIYRQEIFCDANGAGSYHEFAPHEALRPHVASLWTFQSFVPHDHYKVPDGCVDVIFGFGRDRQGAPKDPVFAVAASSDHAIQYSVSGNRESVAMRLRWGAATSLLGFSPAELSEGYIHARDLLGPCADRLAERMLAADDDGSRLAMLQQHFLRWADRRPSLDHRVREAVCAIHKAGPNATVEEIAEDVGLSRSQLRRRLVEGTGMTPKRLLNLTRVRQAMLLGRQRGQGHWGDIAVEVGFFDQAHLITNFKEIVRKTPREWLSLYTP